MAARKNNGTKDNPWSEQFREKVRRSMLANRLLNNALGKLNPEMTPGQIASAKIALDKALPNLATVEHKGEQTIHHVVRTPAQIDSVDQWQKQHAPPALPTIQ